MKKLILVIVIGLVAFNVCGQTVSKFRATDFCYQIKSEYTGRWLEWSNWESLYIMVVVDYNKLRISIYSEANQEYDIIETYDERYESDGDYVIEFRAIDQDGMYCGIRFVDKTSGSTLLCVDYSDVRWAYNIYEL